MRKSGCKVEIRSKGDSFSEQSGDVFGITLLGLGEMPEAPLLNQNIPASGLNGSDQYY